MEMRNIKIQLRLLPCTLLLGYRLRRSLLGQQIVYFLNFKDCIDFQVAELMGKTRTQHDDWNNFVERVCKKMQDDHSRMERLFSEFEAFDEELGSFIRATFQESRKQVCSHVG